MLQGNIVPHFAGRAFMVGKEGGLEGRGRKPVGCRKHCSRKPCRLRHRKEGLSGGWPCVTGTLSQTLPLQPAISTCHPTRLSLAPAGALYGRDWSERQRTEPPEGLAFRAGSSFREHVCPAKGPSAGIRGGFPSVPRNLPLRGQMTFRSFPPGIILQGSRQQKPSRRRQQSW